MSKKKVLGRGLGALMGAPLRKESVQDSTGGSRAATPVGATGEAGGRRFFLLNPADIRPNRLQPRKEFNDEALMELSASIGEIGVIEPLIVTKTLEGYELIAGERRLRASKLAGISEVPVVVMDVSDVESLELALVENIQREDLNAMEEAVAYERLMSFEMTQEEVAKRVGKKRATVANFLRLLKLPPEVKDELRSGSINMGHAKAILSIEGHAAARELCRKIITKGLSVREAEKLAAKMAKEAGAPPKRPPSPSTMGPVEEELKRALGTKVDIKERNGKGSIKIEYYSKEERERLLELLLSLG